MATALEQIARPLRRFIEPQVEQLGIEPVAAHVGFTGTADETATTGTLWSASLGGGCLLSAHRLVPNEQMSLIETPGDYLCIGSLSSATLEYAPVKAPAHVLKQENLVTFAQQAGKTVCTLRAGSVYESRTMTITPSFLKELDIEYPGEFDTLVEDVQAARANELPSELRPLMRSIDARYASLPGAEAFFRAKVVEAACLVVGHAEQTRRAQQAAGSTQQRALVESARRIVERDLAAPLSLTALAEQLYVSRTHLCAAFQAELGMPVGAYVRAKRMEHACDLLAQGSLPIAQIARQVGYARQSSFTEAFRRELGVTPSEWQRESGFSAGNPEL